MPARELITTPFTATSTADDVLAGADLDGVRAIVTGASSGIGAETARALAAAGAEVTLAVRNPAAVTAGPRSRVARLDLADRASVRRFTREWAGPLHLLVNNAGIVTGGPAHTAEGWELQFATNHLGHFALGRRPARGPGPRRGRSRRGADRLGQLDGAHARRRRLRRPAFRPPRV